ncbi:MAG: hypothetical protein ACI4EF_11490 [Coprococcus sp.]
MKKILRDTCILASVMILMVFAVSIIWSGMTGEIMLVFQLFGLSFMLAVVNNVYDNIIFLPILYSYVVKYILVTCLVIMFGFIVGWFYRSNFWMAFIYVAIVFIVAYFLDMFVTQKDVAYINAKIKERDK